MPAVIIGGAAFFAFGALSALVNFGNELNPAGALAFIGVVAGLVVAGLGVLAIVWDRPRWVMPPHLRGGDDRPQPRRESRVTHRR